MKFKRSIANFNKGIAFVCFINFLNSNITISKNIFMPVTNTNHRQDNSGYIKKIWIAGGILLLIVIVSLLFKALFNIILLALAGILIAVYFHGFANILHRKLHLPQGWSLAISVIFNIILVAAFFWFVGARLKEQVSVLSDTLPKTIQEAKSHLQQSAIGNKVLNYLSLSGNDQKTMAVAKTFFSSSFGILSDLYIIILMAAFFIASPSLYKKGIIKLLPSKAKDKGEELLNKITDVLKNWLKGQIFGFLFIAVLTGIGLWIVGMPLVLTLALLAGLLNFIPNFGPIIALIPAVFLALTIGTTTVIIVICFYTFIQIIQSAVTQPLIQQKMVSMPPVLIIFGQVAMGLLAGFWGVLLATPVIAILMTVVNKLYVEKQQQ